MRIISRTGLCDSQDANVGTSQPGQVTAGRASGGPWILILLQSAPKGPWSWGSQAEHIAGVFESVWLWSVAQVRFVFNENCPVGAGRDAEGMDGFF